MSVSVKQSRTAEETAAYNAKYAAEQKERSAAIAAYLKSGKATDEELTEIAVCMYEHACEYGSDLVVRLLPEDKFVDGPGSF